MPTNRRVQDGKKLGRYPLKFKSISQNEIAYLAGYTDGEGCISVINGRTLMVSVEACYPKIIRRYCQLFGGHFSRYDRKKKNTRPYFRWRVFSETAHLVIQTLLPFLREKKRQAELCLKYYNTKNPRKRAEIDQKIRELKKLTYL